MSSLAGSNGASMLEKAPNLPHSKWSKEDINALNDTFVHEFGHAIGLKHEHARTEAEAKSCRNTYSTAEVLNNGQNDIEYIGAYDPQSIENYCSSRSGILTAGDVAGITALYSLGSSVQGRLTYVAAGSDGTVMGVDSNHDIFSWTGSGWRKVPGKLKYISTGSASNIWGINAMDGIQHLTTKVDN